VNWLYELIEESPLATATPVDWVDIALLAWILYRVFLFLRGTRAMQSLLGLAVLGVVYLISDNIGLNTLHWLLDNLFVWVVVAVVILFQDDIRRALARAGGTLFGRSQSATEAQILEEVVRACFALARRKIGALVAIERKAELTPYCEGAHRLDAIATHELIQSLFHPSSPLHDGAVLLQGSRLHSAGVFLPISLSKDVSRAYGTRHRAAIGLTEETDAICLVVSEERGTVSLVQDGEVVPVADPNDLRQRLREGMEREEEEEPPEEAPRREDEDEREAADA
jgi:diadenylate cyclase